MIKGRAPEDLMGDLTKAGVIKILPPSKMSDFLGDHNYLRTLQESNSKGQPDPSLAQLREVCSTYMVLPLANGFQCPCTNTDQIKPAPGVEVPEDFEPKKFECKMTERTFLLYGPQGTGKSLMLRAMAHEARCIVFDISGYNVADRFPVKKSFQQMLVTTFAVAIQYQPSIIFIDEIEQYFPAKVKKPKKGELPHPVIGRCSKFRKDLMTQVKKHLRHTDRVMVVGMTNRPRYCNLKETDKFFRQKFYFPYPDYSARQTIFKHLVEKQGIKLTDSFKLSMFAHISEGVTPGSMNRAIKSVLTKRRKADIELRPLTVQDFIVPLSENYTCSIEEYAIFNKFTQDVTGISAILNARENPDPKANKNKKK